jgi:hypothetical protein
MAFHLALVGATALAILRLTCGAFGRGPAWTAAICYLLVALGWGRPSALAQPDDWLLPFYLWGLFLLASAWSVRAGGWRRAFVAGMLLAWAVNLRATMAPAAVLLPAIWAPLWSAAPEGTGRARRAGALLAAYVAGGAVVTVLTLAYFAATGAMDGLLFAQLVWNPKYAQTSARWDRLDSFGLLRWFLHEWNFIFERWKVLHAAIPLGIAGLAYWRWRRRPIPWSALGVWLIGLGLAAVSLVAQLKMFDYHFWPLLPFMAMAAGPGVWAMLDVTVGALWRLGERAAAGSRARWTARALAAATAVGWILAAQYLPSGFNEFRKRQKSTFNYLIGEDTRLEFYGRFERLGIYRPAEDWEMAEAIRQRTPPGREPNLYLWATHPQIYLLCGTIGPSRFLANFALRAEWTPPEWADELRRELQARPPDLVVVGRNDYFLWIVGSQESSQDTMPSWLRQDLDAHFERVLTLKRCELWQRRP